MHMRFWLLFWMFLLAAWEPAKSGSTAQSASSTGQQPPESAPAIEVRNGQSPGSLELRVTGTADLESGLFVERQLGDGSFEPLRNLDQSSMRLVTSCDQSIGICVRVDEHGLRPVPWSGMSCSSQCNQLCDKNVQLYGRFRFVVRSCDGKFRFEGPVFELPERHR